MNEKTESKKEKSNDKHLENQLFRKNAFKPENNLLPKSLLKDLIEDESSCDSVNENSVLDNSNIFNQKNFDFSSDCLESQTTNPYSNYALDQEMQNRSCTYNEMEMNKKNFKLSENFNINLNPSYNNKINKMLSHNDMVNYHRPKINTLNTMNSIGNMNNNNNNFFNVDSRNFCDEQNYINSNKNNNKNISNIHCNLNSFNSISHKPNIGQTNINNNNLNNNNLNNFTNINQKNMNMRFNNNPPRNNFPPQNNLNNNNFNFPPHQGYLGIKNNNHCNNCFSNINQNNYSNCTMGKNNINQVNLCIDCADESSFIDEGNCSYFPNFNNQNINNNFNCLNNNNNSRCQNNIMNNMNYNQQMNNIGQCRTYNKLNHSGLGTLGIGNRFIIFF
jgi:hypothetical protein